MCAAGLSELLASFGDYPGASALFLDFDGSLAPIVVDPAAARPLPGADARLRALSKRFALVAIVSGRPVAFLASMLPIEGLVLVGQYGMESLVAGKTTVDDRIALHVGAVEAAASEAEAMLPGLMIERKGVVSFSIHWRGALERGAEALTCAKRLATRHGLALLQGRQVAELRPLVPVDKGTAVRALLEPVGARQQGSVRHVLAAGDDLGDVEVFIALAELKAAGQLDSVVRVAVRSEETPPVLLEHADWEVDGPIGLASLLDDLRV